MKLHKNIKESLLNTNDLDQIAINTISVLKEFKDNGFDRIGYVSGIVTSDGPKNIKENVKKLIQNTNKIRKKYNFPIFSSTDMFDEKVLGKLKEMLLAPNQREENFLICWRKILGSGYVTDIFMTSGWERSVGAKDEYEVAKERKLTIHFL